MDPMRLVDPRHLPQLMPLEDREPTVAAGTLGLRNSTPAAGGEAPQHHAVPWVATLLAGVLIATIVVDVIGNLLVIVSVFRNRKLRKAGTLDLPVDARQQDFFEFLELCDSRTDVTRCSVTSVNVSLRVPSMNRFISVQFY